MDHSPTRQSPETLQTDDTPVRRRRRRSRFRKLRRRIFSIVRWRVVLITIFATAIILLTTQVVLVTDATNNLLRTRQTTVRALRSLSNKPAAQFTVSDFERLQSINQDLRRNLNAFDRRISHLRRFASLNPEWESVLFMLESTRLMTRGADDMLTGLEPTVQLMGNFGNSDEVFTTLSSGEQIVERLAIGRGNFLDAQTRIEQARQSLDQTQDLAISTNLRVEVDALYGYLDQLETINTVLLNSEEILTEVLGLEETQRFLIIAQNSDELRPSGGFVSTWGWLVIRGGRVVSYDYYPSSLESPTPPNQPLDGNYDIPPWWLQYENPIYAAWDGSWHVDFSETAEMALWFYENGGNPLAPMDGVIAVDIVGFEYLLDALGIVQVEDRDVIVTSSNFRELVYDIRAFGEGPEPHKEFVADVYESIFSEWETISVDPNTNVRVFAAAIQALREKHILIYSPNPQVAQALDVLGWAGIQTPALDHDYLLAAEANLGNKSNRSVNRQLIYNVDLQPDGALNSELTVEYDYPARIAEADPAVDPEFHGRIDYYTLLQVFTPLGSVLTTPEIEATNTIRLLDVIDTDTHTIMASVFSVPYDTRQRATFRYTTPPLVQEGNQHSVYRLLLEKQPGTIREPVNVQINLPEGARFLDATPEPDATYSLDNIILDYRVTLEEDVWIEVSYE